MTSGRRNSAMITDRRKFTAKWYLYGMSSFHFTVRINSKSFPWAVCCVQETYLHKFSAIVDGHCRALLLLPPRLGMWLACRAYVCLLNTISFYISSFTPLYVYTCIRPIIFSPSPALRDSRDAKTAPSLQSSSSNRRRAHSDAVVEPRSMSLTCQQFFFFETLAGGFAYAVSRP